MKIYMIGVFARQKFGDMVFFKTEAGYFERSKADEHVRSKSYSFEEKFSLPNGVEMVCYCERNVYEVEMLDSMKFEVSSANSDTILEVK